MGKDVDIPMYATGVLIRKHGLPAALVYQNHYQAQCGRIVAQGVLSDFRSFCE